MISHGFIQSTTDPCLYTLHSLSVLVYTDDFLSSYPPTTAGHRLYSDFVTMLTTTFELGDDGFQDCVEFLGMSLAFNADRSAVHITQPKSLVPLLRDANLLQGRPSYTPGIPNTLVSSLDSPAPDDTEQRDFMQQRPFRSRIGSLLWLARVSRPDIAYQVNALARVAHNPGKRHWDDSTYLLRYLSHTQDYGLTYRRTPPGALSPGQWKSTIWTDATWAPDYGNLFDNYRSTSGWCTTVGPNTAPLNLVQWNSNRQSIVALSSTESEYIAATEGAKESTYFRSLIDDLSVLQYGPTPLLCDNESTIKQAINVDSKHRSRHIGQRVHFLRQLCNQGLLDISYIPTTDQCADLFTKCLPRPAHERLRAKIGVLPSNVALA